MALFEALQEYLFRTKSAKANGGENAADIDSLHHRRCSSQSNRCCCAGAARKRDSSTSTYDLSTYVWHTEGDGVGISSSIVTDEDDPCGCQTGRGCGRKQSSFGVRSLPSKGSTKEVQAGNMCDASTSTFDLSSFVWGTEGDMYVTDSGIDYDAEGNGFAHNLGDMNNAARSGRGLGGKRPRSPATKGVKVRSNGGGVAAPPSKKRRRIGNQKD